MAYLTKTQTRDLVETREALEAFLLPPDADGRCIPECRATERQRSYISTWVLGRLARVLDEIAEKGG